MHLHVPEGSRQTGEASEYPFTSQGSYDSSAPEHWLGQKEMDEGPRAPEICAHDKLVAGIEVAWYR